MSVKINVIVHGKFSGRRSYCTVKLKPGRDLRHAVGGPTEEGWWAETTTYGAGGRLVYLAFCRDGCDCDGRISFGSEFVAAEPLGDRWPAWRQLRSHQRDYQAEAAGY